MDSIGLSLRTRVNTVSQCASHATIRGSDGELPGSLALNWCSYHARNLCTRQNIFLNSPSWSNRSVNVHPPKHVAVLIETDDTWGRNVVEAIARYAQASRWTLLICPRDNQRRLRLPKGWQGDGVLVLLRDQSMAQHVCRAKVPAVDVGFEMPHETWLGRVATDDVKRAEMAFEHLRDRGLRHYACYAPPNGRYPHHRADLFRQTAEASGFKCELFTSRIKQKQSSWLDDYQQASAWIAKLPLPLGVFASDPYPARQLAEICQLAEIRIPDDLALMSGDNDDLLCNVACPPISSVELASHAIGYEACEMLCWMIKTDQVAEKPKLIPPLRVISRHSTDILAVADDDLAEILRFIRARANEGVRVSDIIETFPISRRSLEIRFRELLNRTPAEEIRRVRLESARTLVIETDLSIASIAHRCGFSNGASVSHAFRKYFDMTPGELRRAR